MKEKKIPLRKCIGCGESKPKKELLRVVSPKEGEVTLDLTGKADGRGAYICADAGCLAKARKARRLERAFSREIPPEVYDMLEKQLTEAMK
ncbi:MAG: YlxR family protein [Clostridia bacterium]|nr:YlxR family protein [Clostridia bacterium]MBR5769480.1 YlxR family protein [Clostridia bacterium]